jgi:RNA polymerase-binding transcription factor DksA
MSIFDIFKNVENENTIQEMTYTTTSADWKIENSAEWINNGTHHCICCGRVGLPSGDRGLCDGCDEDIPKHIPEEQYVTYMKELWRKR